MQPNVAAAARGDPGFRGGRWQVHALAFNAGGPTDLGVVKLFECPVIPAH